MDEHFSYQLLLDFLKKENDSLMKLTSNKEGILFTPEIYIAFQIGKLLKAEERRIFGNRVEWFRERQISNLGTVDIGFQGNETSVLMELKLKSKKEQYEKDIQKLLSYGTEYHRYFIALLDTWKGKMREDDRINFLSTSPYLTEIGLTTFETVSTDYTGEIDACFGVWRVNN